MAFSQKAKVSENCTPNSECKEWGGGGAASVSEQRHCHLSA